MPVFGKPMRWVTCVTAPILLADVGDYRFRVFSLDLKRSDERIFGVHGDVVRLPFQFKPDGELHPARLLYPILWARRLSMSSQRFGNKVRCAVIAASVFKRVFFKHGGPHEAIRLESVDPGGVIADNLPLDRMIASVVYAAAPSRGAPA
jgi:hypothetical protein